MNKRILAPIFLVALLFAGIAIAQKPVENVNPNRHPKLAAQRPR